jgi:dienelactone hydrolase
MAITTEDITYDIDGVQMRSRFYSDEAIGKPRPGVLVYADARGLDDVAHASARRLAEEGYPALACDVYGGGLFIEKPDDAIPYASKVVANPDALAAGGRVAMDALGARPQVDAGRIAAIGYCFGGNVAVEIARGGLPLLAAVGFHGGVVPANPERSRKIKGKVLICTGASDPMIPIAMRTAFEEDMQAAGVDWRMNLYGQIFHSFTNPDAAALRKEGLRYDACAAERSWQEMKALLAEVFG